MRRVEPITSHDFNVDVAVLGAGFGGSLAALILARLGRSVVLIDRGQHPRFAIGESSTPAADLVLRALCARYDLPRIAPLAQYGSWVRAYPNLTRGLKRGFSYFRHRPGSEIDPKLGEELLFPASDNDETSDTHWYRAEVDEFFAGEAEAAGVPYFDRTHITSLVNERGWHLGGARDVDSIREPIRIRAQLLIDATGEAQVLPRALGIPNQLAGLHTHSRAIFAHFTGLRSWPEMLAARGARTDLHPYVCDRSALHHLVAEGWMWQLGFDNGVVSAGFALDTRRSPLDTSVPPEQEWHALLARYPSLRAQFADANIVAPEGGLRRTGRLQRRVRQAAGPDWALLPNTAAFTDPLHSTGIAHTLYGIERLAGIMEQHWNRSTLPAALGQYSSVVLAETAMIDRIVGACYDSLHDFRQFTQASVLYFLAATTQEDRRRRGTCLPGAAFLCADDPHFQAIVAAHIGHRKGHATACGAQ